MTVTVSSRQHPEWLTNTYLVRNDEAKHCIVIDTGLPPSLFEKELTGYTVDGIFLTHHHHDHVEALSEWERLGAVYDTAHEPFVLETGTVTVIKTPGHTKDHLAYVVNNQSLFTGDLLFKGSVGGTREGDFTLLRNSILSLVLTLPRTTIIYPGHSNPSQIDEELQSNPFVKAFRSATPAVIGSCTVSGKAGKIIVQGRDYDGELKFWINLDGKDHILPEGAVNNVRMEKAL